MRYVQQRAGTFSAKVISDKKGDLAATFNAAHWDTKMEIGYN